MATPTLDQAFAAISSPQARSVIVAFANARPQELKVSAPGRSTLLHEIVTAGNVVLLRELIRIPGVWFPRDFKDAAGRTLQDANQAAVDGPLKRNMEIYLNFLNEWDDMCELAKNYINSENERVWAWLRRNAQHCYTTPPSRKWSIAMQVVFYGDIGFLDLLLNMCPQSRGGPPIWEARGNDGMTLLNVAEDGAERFPEMYEFVSNRAAGINTSVAEIQQQYAAAPPPAPPVVDDLAEVRAMWNSIQPASITRPIGECPIEGDRVRLYTCSRDCNHAFGENALSRFFGTVLNAGPFPIRCPSCTAENTNRGLVTRGTIKALVNQEILTRAVGERVLNQQIRSLPNEASLDLQYSMSKPCPYCTTPIAHYKGHGCHHIRPGGGCPSCHHHFCYTCLSSHDDGSRWQGCPNDDPLFCTEDCDCPLCPDCTPGNPCDACDGVGSACPRCRV